MTPIKEITAMCSSAKKKATQSTSVKTKKNVKQSSLTKEMPAKKTVENTPTKKAFVMETIAKSTPIEKTPTKRQKSRAKKIPVKSPAKKKKTPTKLLPSKKIVTQKQPTKNTPIKTGMKTVSKKTPVKDSPKPGTSKIVKQPTSMKKKRERRDKKANIEDVQDKSTNYKRRKPHNNSPMWDPQAKRVKMLSTRTAEWALPTPPTFLRAHRRLKSAMPCRVEMEDKMEQQIRSDVPTKWTCSHKEMPDSIEGENVMLIAVEQHTGKVCMTGAADRTPITWANFITTEVMSAMKIDELCMPIDMLITEVEIFKTLLLAAMGGKTEDIPKITVRLSNDFIWHRIDCLLKAIDHSFVLQPGMLSVWARHVPFFTASVNEDTIGVLGTAPYSGLYQWAVSKKEEEEAAFAIKVESSFVGDDGDCENCTTDMKIAKIEEGVVVSEPGCRDDHRLALSFGSADGDEEWCKEEC